MKRSFIICGLAAMLLSTVSCQKEEDVNVRENDGLVFSATIDNGDLTKTTIEKQSTTPVTYKVSWKSGDAISINGVKYTATPGSDATTATFTKDDSQDDPSGTFYAFYPFGIQSGSIAGGTLPSTQTYVEGEISNVPMYATSTTTTLSFKNMCSVLAVTVKNADFASVKSIQVSSSNCALSGAFTISNEDNQTAVLTDATVVANTVILNCGKEAVTTASDGTVFYIAIPAQTYRNLRIDLSSDGTNYTRAMVTKNSDINVASNKVYPLTFKSGITFGLGITYGGNASACSVSSAD